ncbi:MAG: hypothetical protein K2X47_09870 [Bdellovibrionales bacterium]|nr:hypothetical protein [Bdellovibrionales bacterium]
MKIKKLIIFGNTMVAKLAHYYFHRDSDYRIEAFTVDSKFMTEATFLGLPVVEFDTVQEKYSPEEYFFFVAVGPNLMNVVREEKFIEAKRKGYRFANYVSPNAVCGSELGENSLVADMAVINPFAELGDNNFFWDFSLISNDCIIRSHCYISPKAVVSSFCDVKNNSIIGTGSIIKARITLAEKTLVGAGCYISKNTAFKGVYGEKSSLLLGCISDKIDISL